MDRRRLGLALVAFSLGCGGRAADQVRYATAGAGPGTGGAASSGQGGSTDAGAATPADAATGDAGGATAGGTDAGTRTGCGALALSPTITLAPTPPGQSYVRCQTLGPEQGWRVALSPTGDRLAALTGAGTVRLFDTGSWRELAQLGSSVGEIDVAAYRPATSALGPELVTLSAEMGEVTDWYEHAGAILSGRGYGGPPASTLDTVRSSFGLSSDGMRIATSLGTTIDLDTGQGTSWKTGAVATVTPAVDPEYLGRGASPSLIRFTPGDRWLLVVTFAQSGDAPATAQIELRDPTTGEQVVSLFQGYEPSLLGYPVSPDGKYLALARTPQGTPQGEQPGLFVYDLATGAVLSSGPTVTDTVLGFSPTDGAVYTRNGATISLVLTAPHLSPSGLFTWPADAVFLGVAPEGDLVESDGQTTSWWDPVSGAVARRLDYPLTAITWSADGRFGAGTGDPAALFHFWRETDGVELCAPPADTTVAPALASLGSLGPASDLASVTSADGELTVVDPFIGHEHFDDWTALTVTATATGDLMRQFGATDGLGSIALSVPAADRLYTPVGPDVAVWCR
jgi:WD40 repeat protein